MTYTPLYKLCLVRDSSVKAESKLVGSPSAVAEFLKPIFAGLDREQFVIILVSADNHALGVNVVSVGTLSASLAHPREVFKAAILANAAGVIVAHNHPSGDLRPSLEDRETTRRLQKAGAILGIPLHDHLILAFGTDPADPETMKYTSFRESGLLNEGVLK